MQYTIQDLREWAASVREGASQYPAALYQPVRDECLYFAGYVKDGPVEEGCLLGQYMVTLFPETEQSWLMAVEESEGGYGIDAVLSSANWDFVGGYDQDNERDHWELWFSRVQSGQDSGHTWSQAVAYADDFMLEEYGVDMGVYAT